jgi:hypothetical protein
MRAFHSQSLMNRFDERAWRTRGMNVKTKNVFHTSIPSGRFQPMFSASASRSRREKENANVIFA